MFYGSGRISILTLFLGWCVSTALAEPAPDRPSDATNPADRRVWELNDYLKGNAPKIRDLVNGELERLTAKQKDLRQRDSGYDAAIVAEHSALIAAVHKSDAYQKLAAEKIQAEAALNAARENGTAQEKLDASSKFNRIRAAMEKMETSAVAADVKIPQLLKDKKEDQQELKRCDEAVNTAQKWRDHLIGAIRDTFKLNWPLEIGASGTLGIVTPLEDPDASGIVVEFGAFERLKEGAVQEGVMTTMGVFHKVRLRVSGIDTRGISKGTPVALDRNFTIVRRVPGEERERTYEARPAKDDVDRLFELLIPLRELPPPSR